MKILENTIANLENIYLYFGQMGSKMENLELQTRLDWYDNAIDYETSPAEKTAEGFIVARAPVTSVGVFTYRNDDGTPRRELRLPEEVFSDESLATLKMKPLTLLHPEEKYVTPENAERLQIGSVGEAITTDSYRVYAPLAVTRQDGIDAVNNGTARGLSCGYKCDIEWTSGTWMGVPYDCIQRNIRYNHIALVPVPRAGDGNAIRMDGYGELENFNKNEEEMNMKTIHLDGADYQAEPQVIAALDKAVARADAAEAEVNQLRAGAKTAEENFAAEKASIEAERDSFKERLDAAEKEMPSKIQAAVDARLEIVGKAQNAGVEVRNDMADADIKKAVILKQFPSAELEGKDAAYIDARFDCACELVKADAENKCRQDAAENKTLNNVKTSAQEALEKSRANYNARLDSAWQDKT